jgi:diguanylate cyclase (GGDEF)-like protein
MQERRRAARSRTLLEGKILLNDRRSAIDCVVRNLSQHGACLQVPSVVGIPPTFDLQIDHETATRPCVAVWHAQSRIGIEFRSEQVPLAPHDAEPTGAAAASDHNADHPHDVVRGEMLSLRAALNEVPIGIVLLDAELRARFINRAFRKMWRLPNAKADSKPAFVALMYHGRDTCAYDVPEDELKTYIATRVAHVRAGDPRPADLRLKSGEVIRSQCTALPNGGRMLSYIYVTDIVQAADELEALRSALDTIEQGVTLLDRDLVVQYMNEAARELMGVTKDAVERKPPFATLMNATRLTRRYALPAAEHDRYVDGRVDFARRGDPTPVDLQLNDGRHIRSRCAVLPNGGRMLTYSDITDLMLGAAELQHQATIDGMTELYNRRHFLTLAEAEWQRFQRYQRPLALLIFDIDHFKFINDGLGHDAGDRAIAHVAALAREDKRPTDILARLGGDEFVLLLPETELRQAAAVAERLREKVAQGHLGESSTQMKITVSIGAAGATASMSSVDALLKAADEALYRAKFLGRNQVSLATPAPVPRHDVAAE